MRGGLLLVRGGWGRGWVGRGVPAPRSCLMSCHGATPDVVGRIAHRTLAWRRGLCPKTQHAAKMIHCRSCAIDDLKLWHATCFCQVVKQGTYSEPGLDLLQHVKSQLQANSPVDCTSSLLLECAGSFTWFSVLA